MKKLNLLRKVPLAGEQKKLFFISNTANEDERKYVFGGETIGYKIWQKIFLGKQEIATLGAVNCIADDFSDRHKLAESNATSKIISLVSEAVKRGFSVFVLGASTKYVINKLKKKFSECIFLGGNELTATAIVLQEKHFLDADKNILILGGSTNLATLNAQLLRSFMLAKNIRPNARGTDDVLAKKFVDTGFVPVGFDEINNGFRTTQVLNSIHLPLLQDCDFKRLGIEICLEVARPTVYSSICNQTGVRWAQLGVFEHPELIWENPLYDTKKKGLFACFLAGYIFSKYGEMEPVKALKLAIEDGFKLQHTT